MTLTASHAVLVVSIAASCTTEREGNSRIDGLREEKNEPYAAGYPTPLPPGTRAATSLVAMRVTPTGSDSNSAVFDFDVEINAPVNVEWTYSHYLTKNGGKGLIQESGPSEVMYSRGGTAQQAATHRYTEVIDTDELADGFYMLHTKIEISAPSEPGRPGRFGGRYWFMKHKCAYYGISDLAAWYAKDVITSEPFPRYVNASEEC